jgi:hypothetical protein
VNLEYNNEAWQRAAYQGSEHRQIRVDPIHGVDPCCWLARRWMQIITQYKEYGGGDG